MEEIRQGVVAGRLLAGFRTQIATQGIEMVTPLSL